MLAINGAAVDQDREQARSYKGGTVFFALPAGTQACSKGSNHQLHAYATADGYRSDQGLSIRRAGMRGD